MERTSATHKKLIEYLDRVQPEPDYSAALANADYDALFSRLLEDGLVKNNPLQWNEVVRNVRENGAYGLITANSESLDTAVKEAKEFLRVLQRSAQVVEEKRFLPALEEGQVPIFQQTNRTLVAVQSAAEDCEVAALVAKELRGTAGWMTKGSEPATSR